MKHEPTPFPLPVAPPKTTPKTAAHFSRELFDEFFSFPIQKAQKLLEEKPAAYWEQTGQERALELFHAAAERVPAYKDFLKKNKIRPAIIKNADDFKNVPPIDKEYLKSYPLPALCWDGKLEQNQMIAVSSGSSGEPFFWPRGSLLELETTYMQELYLHHIFQVDKYKTLFVNAFAMGMYIAGPIILNSALRIGQKGYPMTVVTPGLEIHDVMQVIQGIAKHYDQIILAGYPPFIKDVVDEGVHQKFDWKKHHIRFLLAGEGFNESWREYLEELVGQNRPTEDFINIYGTADASIVGHETPTSIAIRRKAAKDEGLASKLFFEHQNGRLPTFVQYIPTLKYFESVDKELVFTSTAGLPLVRYNIHDIGNTISFDNALEAVGADPAQLFIDAKTEYQKPWRLPFVYLYGRSDFTVVWYGANIYPENIKRALESEELRKILTGRFTMSIEHTSDQTPYLHIHTELAKGVQAIKELEEKTARVVSETLLSVNDEYRSSYDAKGGQTQPSITLHKNGDEQYFTRGRSKQRWTKHNDK